MRRRLEQRRRRLRELAAADARNRCAFCRRALPAAGAQMFWPGQERFCSQDCYDDAKDVERVMEEVR